MAGGKSTKRVNLRAKIARKQQAQLTAAPHTDGTASASPTQLHTTAEGGPDVSGSSRRAPYGHAEEDHQTALQIRDALRQRQGRTGRAPATKATGSTSAALSGRDVAGAGAAATEQDDARRTRRAGKAALGGGGGVAASKRLLNAKKKATKKDSAAQHPAALRRAAVQERRRLVLPVMSAAETRMATAQEELQLFDKVQTVPAYAADPFAAIMQHLSMTMDTLQPQTPDVGRAARN